VPVDPKTPSYRILGSAIYDWLVILGLLMIAGFMAVQLNLLVTGAEAIAPHNRLFQVYLLGIIIGYYFYFWRRSGQTVGMKAWRIRLVTLNDESLTWRHMSLRMLGAVPAFGVGLLGIVWQHWDKAGLNWHDHISQTKLVYRPKPSL
jgi:uncharacterized RDD family membrane protein YckC|tara:strand:+ start:577 stop:1017 length:441 start_codon:yes stop_codon:yes gene_type:complete